MNNKRRCVVFVGKKVNFYQVNAGAQEITDVEQSMENTSVPTAPVLKDPKMRNLIFPIVRPPPLSSCVLFFFRGGDHSHFFRFGGRVNLGHQFGVPTKIIAFPSTRWSIPRRPTRGREKIKCTCSMLRCKIRASNK